MPESWRGASGRMRSMLLTWGVLAVGVAISVLTFFIVDARVDGHGRLKAEAAIAEATDAIRERLHSSFDIVYGVQGLFRSSEDVTREEFNRYVSGLKLKERHPGIRSVTYAEVVPHARKAQFEARVRGDRSVYAAGYPHFSIKPPHDSALYAPIMFIEPFAGNEAGLGLDLLEGERQDATERARDTGTPVLSSRLALASDPAREPAVSVRFALYLNGMPTGTVGERRAAFAGVVSATFMMRSLVADVLGTPALTPVSVRLYDRVTIAGGAQLGAQRAEYTLFERSAPVPAAPTDPDYFNRDMALEVGGRDWRLDFSGSTDDFVTPTDRALPWILLLGGLVVSGLLAGLVSSLASSRERARRLAVRITEDLRQSEAKLAEAQSLTQSMIEALPNPIFFKGGDGRYLGVNRAWEKLFGISRERFIGKTVYDLYPNDRRLAEERDRLDRELWANPGTQMHEAVIPTADGATHDVLYYKATYTHGNGELAGIIGTIIDISERKQAERRQMMEHAITRVLAEAGSADVAITKIIQTICETMGWHYGDRYEYDKDMGALRRREMWGIDTPEIQAFAEAVAHRVARPDPKSGGLVRRTFAAGKPIWISDITKDPGLQRKELIARAGLHGAFAFPLTAGGEVLGIMEFFHRDVREPDAMLIAIAESIGRQIGQFLVRTQAEQAVKFVAMHDTLTNLPNRAMFNERLEQAIAQAQRHERRLAVMFIDLDRFKIINDTLGHEAGDQLLREVAERLTDQLRTADIVARLGGDEFVVLLQDIGEPAAVAAVAEKLIAALAGSFTIAGNQVHVSGSIGISTYPVDAQDMRSLLRFADIAMYRAKDQGRNTFQFYSEQMNVHSVERLTLEAELRGALERDELVLHYQPVVNAQTGVPVGMEALVRWRHPARGLVPPVKFIGIAEETGLIVPIGEWVLATACAQQRKWIDAGLPSLRIAVNLSPRQFVHRDLLQDIVRVLARSGCETSSLELEITESTIMHNAARAAALLAELKAMGIHVAIDDFGTGYSSLAYLKRFPIDALKIDRSFVSEVPGDPSNAAITQAIIAMAHSLGLTVIGEGVETVEQLEFLKAHGCEEVQGAHFSLALAEPDATAFLQRAFAAQQPSNVTSFDRRRR
ncbi:MAG TPA: EAL domain-containing protein [Burkholderiales bacterium]|nr:EAL domain-containing protein [Burkholderiales bacterium]